MLDPAGREPRPEKPIPFPKALTSPPRLTLATQVLAGPALLGVLQFHLLGSLLAGLLVYELVHLLAPSHTSSFVHRRTGKIIVVALLAVLVIAATGAIRRTSRGLSRRSTRKRSPRPSRPSSEP